MKKKIFIFTLLLAFLGGSFVFTNFALAQADTLSNLGLIAGKAKLNKSGGDLPTLLGQVLGAALSFVGVIFFLLMIYGGILWMTARGNDQQTNKALDIIIAAVIGLIIVLGSYALVYFVFSKVGTTADVKKPVCSNNRSPGCEAVACASHTTPDNCNQLGVGCCQWQ